MKKPALFFFLFLIARAAMAQTTAEPQDALQFKEEAYDFGAVPQGKPVYHFFQIKNSSAKPVTLNDVHASCGCTTPEWSKDRLHRALPLK